MSLKDLLNRFTSRKSGLSMCRPENFPDPGLDDIPDFVEPLVGWRAWKVRPRSPAADTCPVFRSVILDTPWAPRRQISAEHSFDLGARCHGLLGPECSCGIYAFKDPLEALIYLTRVRDRLLGMSAEVALGTVSLWGRVVECERGYKAEYAYPHHIYLPASFARFVPVVSSEFGVASGIYASICEEEISLVVSAGPGGRETRKLHLKNSGSLKVRDFSYEVGFYDLMALPGGKNRLPAGAPDFSPPAAWDSEAPGNDPWF